MRSIGVFPETVFSMGPVHVTDTVVTTWLVIAVIGACSYLLSRRLSVQPSLLQEIVESAFEAVERP